MQRGQEDIGKETEYNFMRQLMGEMHKELPKLKIDVFGCKCLKSSLELTKTLVKTNSKGKREIKKDKSSEKLALKLRPMFSTNFSDALKYLMCRPAYMQHYNKKGVSFSGADPSVV